MITKEEIPEAYWLGINKLEELAEKLLQERDEAYRKAIENDAELRKSWYDALQREKDYRESWESELQKALKLEKERDEALRENADLKRWKVRES